MLARGVVVGGEYHQQEGWSQPRRMVDPAGGTAGTGDGGGEHATEAKLCTDMSKKCQKSYTHVNGKWEGEEAAARLLQGGSRGPHPPTQIGLPRQLTRT